MLQQCSRQNGTGARYISGCVESHYVLEKLLGKGLFGVVEARRKGDDERVAVKLSTGSRSFNARETLLREAEFHTSLDHPNIVKLREVFHSALQVALVMDVLEGGDSFSLVDKGRLPESQAAAVLLQANSALQYLHDRGLVHGDVKPENLVFADKDQTRLVLVDFGCMQRTEDIPQMVLAPWTRLSTVAYMAPEVYRCEVYDGKADMWSLGITAFVFLTQCIPWANPNLTMVCTPHLWPAGFHCLSDAIKDFVRALLRTRASDRLAASKARLHPWLCAFNSSGGNLVMHDGGDHDALLFLLSTDTLPSFACN